MRRRVARKLFLVNHRGCNRVFHVMILTSSEAQPVDTHSYFYSERAGSAIVSKVTHQVSCAASTRDRVLVADPSQNITAGIAGVLSAFPADKRPSAGLHDVVGTAISLNTPLGSSIAMATLWSGESSRIYWRCRAQLAYRSSPAGHRVARYHLG